MAVVYDPLLKRIKFGDSTGSGTLSLTGISDTYAGFPDATENNGKIAFLTSDDGLNLAGFYLSNGTTWEFSDIDITAVIRTTDPTVDDDGTAGYLLGQTWVNTSNKKIYISTDITAGAAVWMDFSQYSSGYSHTGAFAGKPLTNNYVWQAGTGINYTSQNANDGIFKLFSFDRNVHLSVDQPYWTDPAPGDPTDIGLFAGANLPTGVSSLFDFSYDYDTENASITHQYYALNNGTETGHEGSVGRIKLNECVPGDQLRVRFDFNAIPQSANTTLEPALWYSNRNANDEITFSFPLTSQPVFYGTGTVGDTFLNRIEISAWITSTEDVNALLLPAIKCDNPIIIQPLGVLVTIIR